MEQMQNTYMIVVGGCLGGDFWSLCRSGGLFDQEDSERKEFLGGVFIR